MRLSTSCIWSFCTAAMVLSACGTSENNDTSNGSGAESYDGPAYMFVNRIRTPDSQTNYVSVLPSLEAQSVDLEAALEVPGFSRFRIHNGKVFVFEGETLEVARYGVGADLVLEEEARFSMAQQVSEFRLSIAFAADERAYVIDPVEQRVVVWNPQSMEITDTFDLSGVSGLERENLDTTVGKSSVVGDYVVTPMAWVADTGLEPVVAILVLSASSNEVVGLYENNRCARSFTGFVHGGDYYVLGDWRLGVYDVYDPDTDLPDPCLVRWTPGEESFDPDYYASMRALTGGEHVDGAFGTIDGKIVSRVYDADFPSSQIPADYPNPSAYFSLALWRWAVIDLEAETRTLLDELPLTGTSFQPAVIDAQFYVPVLDEDEQASTLYAIDADSATTTESVSTSGDIVGIGRIQ